MDNKPERGDHWTCFLFSIPVFDHLGDPPHGSPVQKDGVLINETKQYKYIGKVGGKQVIRSSHSAPLYCVRYERC